MIDPVPPPPTWLSKAVRPVSDILGFQTLPYHVHEILFAVLLYQTVQSIISPVFSTYVFPNIYPKLNSRTKLNWDVHMVSMVQSCLINTLALWVILTDNERREMNALERIYGYTGGCGMIQGLAAGYFLWDFVLCTRHYKIFGPGLWAHAVSALVVFSFGFRPFCNYYGPTFILYELSSPFLNIHWFCDKLNLTGSKIQWYNGIILLATFFSCRLAWGTYQSVHVYQDVWAAMHVNATTPGHLNLSHAPSSAAPLFVPRNGELCLGNESCARAQAEVMRFTGAGTSSIPFWLAGLYLVSNILLNTLNFFWFGRMIETVTKRFKEIPSKGKKVERRPSMVIEVVGGLEQDDRMHGSMVFENEGKSTGMDGGVRVKRR